MKCAASQPVSQSASQAFWLSANEGEEANVACNGDGSVGGCMGYGFPVPVPARERVPGRLVLVCRRGADGTWRITHAMTSRYGETTVEASP